MGDRVTASDSILEPIDLTLTIAMRRLEGRGASPLVVVTVEYEGVLSVDFTMDSTRILKVMLHWHFTEYTLARGIIHTSHVAWILRGIARG